VGLTRDLGRGPVALDTCVFIYWMEEHPEYLPLVAPLFESIDAGRVQALTSAVTLLEVLVVPYRLGDSGLAERYELLLTRSRGVTMVTLDNVLLRAAAQLRAVTGVRTPDALQLAAALRLRATAFVTNDRGLPDVGGLRVIQLERYL
jgi:predicted nucleic acid-binding protein